MHSVMLGLCFTVLFPPSFAAGGRLRAAASPCGWTWTLFLQLKDQLERIHYACLYQQFDMVEIIRSLHPTSSSISVLHSDFASSKKTVKKIKNKKCRKVTLFVVVLLELNTNLLNSLYNGTINSWTLSFEILVYGSVSPLSDTGCSLNQHLTVAVLSRTKPKAFYCHYHKLAVLIGTNYLRTERDSPKTKIHFQKSLRFSVYFLAA